MQRVANRRTLNRPIFGHFEYQRPNKTVHKKSVSISDLNCIFTALNQVFTCAISYKNLMAPINQPGGNPSPTAPDNTKNPTTPDGSQKPTGQPQGNMGQKFNDWSQDAAQKFSNGVKVNDFDFLGGNDGKSVAGIYLNGKDGNGGVMKISRDTIKLYDQNNDNQINYEEYVKKELDDYKKAYPNDTLNSEILIKIAKDTTNYDGKTNYADFVQKEIDDYKKANPNVVLDEAAIKKIKETAVSTKLAFDTIDLDHKGQIDEKEEAAYYAAMDSKGGELDGKISQEGFVGVSADLVDPQYTNGLKDKFKTYYTFLFDPKK